MTRKDLINFVKENAIDIADLVKAHDLETTIDPRYAAVLERELRQRYEPLYQEDDRASVFDN